MILQADMSRVRARAAALVAEADRLVQPDERAARLTEVGDLYRDSAASTQASEYYFQAVAVHPEAPNVALSRLAQLARETGDVAVTANLIAGLSHAGHWKDVVTVLTRQADSVHDSDERAGLLLEASRLCQNRLNDFGRARTYLLSAARAAGQAVRPAVLDRLEDHLRRNPADDTVAVAFARLLTTEGDPARAIKVMVKAARNALEKPRRAALLLDAAILCADRTRQPVEALVHLYEALTLDPELQAQVQARLDAIQARWLHLAQVGDALEGIYTRLRLPERVQEVMEARLAIATPEERPALLQRLAEHAEYQLIEPERAFQLYRQGLEEGRGDLDAFAAGMRRAGAEGVAGAVDTMSTLFSRLARWRDLVDVLDGEASLQAADADQAALLFRGGEILQTHLDDLEGAMQRYVKAFQLQPSNPRYLAAGERLYRRRKDWRMVDRLLGLQVQIAGETDQRQRLLVEQARVRHRKLNDPLGAYQAVRQALQAGPMEPASSALRELVCDDRAFAVLERGLRDRAAAAASDAEAADELRALAALQLELRGEPGAALSALAEAFKRAPADVELFRSVASMMAEHAEPASHARWLAEAAARRGLPVELRLAALGSAARLFEGGEHYGQARDARRAALSLAPRDPELFEAALEAARAAGEPGPLARLLSEALEGERGPANPPPATRQGWRRELAAARSALGDDETAAECWQAVLAEAPDDDEAFAWLAAWYESREAWEALRGLLDTVAEAREAAEGQPALELLEELADLAEGALADPRLAVVYARRLLDAEPDSEAARDRLHRLFGLLGDREGQIGLLELELVTAPGDAREALALRLVELSGVPPVIHAARRRGLEALLALAPDDVRRLDQLAAALRDEDTPAAQQALSGVLARRWAAAPNPANAHVLRELATVLATLGAPPEDVARAWTAVLDVVPADDDALAGLQVAHARGGDDEAVLAVIARRRAALPASHRGERRRLLREAAMVAEVRLGDLPRAMDTWATALADAPGDAEALDELVRLAELASDTPALLRHGRQRLEQLEGEDRLALARRLARAVEADPPAMEQQGQDAVDEASRLWGLVHRADPHAVDALEGLARAADARGDRAGLLSALDRLADRLTGAALRPVHVRRAAALTDMGDLGAAVEAWEAVRALDPESREPVTAIRRLSLERKDWWSAARALAAELRFVTDPGEALALNRQLARVSMDALGDQLGAMAAWERVLDLRPDDADALAALKGIYADLSRTEDLVRVLRKLLEGAPDDAARVRELVDAARLLERLRGDLSEVFECWRRAFVLTSGDRRPILAELRRLAEAADLWRRYADVLDVARKHADGPGEEAVFIVEQARVVERHLGEPDRAFVLARAAFDLLPDDGPTLALLVRLAEARGAWEDVVQARVLVASRGVDRARRAELLRQAGEVTEIQLARPDDAFGLYAQALDAGSKEAEAALVRLSEARGLWPRLIEVVNARWKGRKPAGPRVEALLKLAALLEEKAGDWERAFEQVIMALQLEPRHEQARQVAWRLAEEHDAWGIVARVLDLKANDAEDPWIKASLLRDLAEIQADRLGEPARAFQTLKRAFAVRPWDEETQLAIGMVASRTGAQRELATFLEEEAGWAEESTARTRLFRMAADIHQREGDAAEAARILERVAELEPADAGTVDALLALRREAADPAELAAALENHARVAPPERQKPMLEELADLFAGPLDAPTRAEETWRQLLNLDPADAWTFARLARSLRERAAWRELEVALERRARQVRPVDRVALLGERADILWGRLGRVAEAFALWVEVAEAHPDDLDRLFALADRADAAKGYGALVACAERSLAVAPPDQQPRVLVLIGRTARDHLGNPTRALEALSLALDLAPSAELAREVADLLRARRRFGELVALYREHGPVVVAGPDEAADAPAVLERWALLVAGLQADQLYRLDEAAATIRALLDAHPGSVDGWERLRSLALRRRDGEELADAVIGLAEAAAPALAISVLETGARDVARLGANDRAVELWKRVLARAPGRADALDALEALAGRQRDAGLRAETLAQRAATTRGAEDRAGLLCELGALHRDVRGDAAAAEAAFRDALAAAPRHLDALEALAELAQARGDEAALADLTQQLIKAFKRSRAEATRGRLAPRIAELLARRARQAREQGDADGELSALEEGWAIAPRHPALGQALADAYQARDRLADAARIYVDLPAPAGDGADDGARKAAEHLRRARAFAHAGDDTRAVRHFDAATHHASTQLEALAALAGIQEAAGRWEAAIRLHLKRAEAVVDAAERQAAHVAAGRIAEHRLGKQGRAVGLYSQAVRDGLTDAALLREALPALAELGAPADALTAVDRLLAGEHDPRRRAALLATRAEICDRAGDQPGARSARHDALALGPIDLASARGLLAHLEEAPPADQVEILRRVRQRLAHERGPQARSLLAALAETLLRRGDAAGALDVYRSLVAIDPRHLAAHEALAELYQDLAAAEEPAAFAHLEQAVVHQLAVVRARPFDAEPLRALADLYARCGQPGWREDPLCVLAWLRVATEEEEAEREALASGPAPVPTLDAPGRMERVQRDVWREAAGTLLRALFGWLGEELDALFGGAPTADPTGARRAEDEPAFAEDFVRVRAALGLASTTLWVVDGDRAPGIWRVHPVEIVVGRGWLAGSQRERVFRLARTLELGRGPALLAAYAPEDEARALFGAAIVLALGDDGMSFAREVGAQPGLVNGWVEFLDARLDQGRRDALERFVGAIVATGPGSFHVWSGAVRQAACRVGHVLSGDLGAALAALRDEAPGSLRQGRREGPEGLRALFDRAPLVAELHAFAFGEELLALRRLLARGESRPPMMSRVR